MLREIKPVAQPPEAWLRVFSDDLFLLTVWYLPWVSTPMGFQLSYERGPNEKVLTWFRGSGFLELPHKTRTTFSDRDLILRLFKMESMGIDPAVADFVCKKVAEFSSSR